MKDSQQESHTEADVLPKGLDYFYNEKGDWTITLNEQPVAYTPEKHVARHFCQTFNDMKATIEKQAKTNQELYAKLQKIKALTTEIR